MNKNRFKKARELVSSDNYESAEEWLRFYIKKHPNDSQAFLNLSIVLTGLGKEIEASNAQKKALEIDPNCNLEFSKFSIFPNDGDRALSEVEKESLLKALNIKEDAT